MSGDWGSAVSVTGGCQCGTVRYQAGAVIGTARCHCTDCQAQSGAGFGHSVYVPAGTFEINAETACFEQTADSGNRVQRLFCPRCGVRIAHIKPGGGYVSLKGGTLDPEHRVVPAAEIWTGSKLPWVALLPGLPAWESQPEDMGVVMGAYAKARTKAAYNERADAYDGSFARATPDADLLAFMAELRPGGRVLDLGCGPGNSAQILAKAGFSAEASDVSEEMVRIAVARPGVSARMESFDEIDPSPRYDGIWANFSLLHSPKRDFHRHLRLVAQMLVPGGILHLGMKLGEGEGPDPVGRHYAYYSTSELKDALSDVGLTLVAERHGTVDGMVAKAEPFIILRARNA